MRKLSLLNCRLDKRYDVERQLGSGSYAEIFVARDIHASPHSAHGVVVIKALNVMLQDDIDPDLERTLVENFQNEAIALDRVRHPNIISRLGHGTARDLDGIIFHYLVLEYLSGGDLQKVSRKEQISINTALKYIEQVCAGLGHAHDRGIIHRDIKPQNLLRAADGETIKIADFGVARVHHTDSPITRVGTSAYAPPEHSPMFAGDIEISPVVTALTPAADIYSLAKSVYTLVTGETPRFYANQPITDLPISAREKKWAAEIKRVLNKATLNNASLRHQTVDEFWADLEVVRRIAAAEEPPSGYPAVFKKTAQPHISRGYSPIPAARPRFDTSRDLKSKHPFIPRPKPAAASSEMHVHDAVPEVERRQIFIDGEDHSTRSERPEAAAAKPKRSRRLARQFSILALLLSVFGAVLYGTSAFNIGQGLFPRFSNPFSERTGQANTDINLRPAPNANNDPIGMVTKNSRVRIVKIQNNWYQVDVLEQGRERPDAPATNRGWINGKYIDLDQ